MNSSSSKKPHILVTTSTFPRWKGDNEPGFVFELCRRLNRFFEITVLAPRSPGSRKHEKMSGLKVVRFPYFFNRWEDLANHGGGIVNRLKAKPLNILLLPFFIFGQFLAFARLLCRKDFALVHAHWIVPQGLLAVITRFVLRKKVPVVCTSHGGDLYGLQGFISKNLKRRVIKNCDKITVVSRAMKNAVLEQGAAEEKVSVMPMGVDLQNLFTPDSSAERSLSEVLFVGRFVEKKGLHILIDAMPEIIEKHPVTALTVAGAGPLEEKIKKQVKSRGISNKVRFLGMVSQADLPVLYRRAALSVFPFVVAEGGDQEGLGLVVVEAMGCGCPVVASDLPAVRDTVEHENTGFLVPPGDKDELAGTVIRVLNSPGLMSSITAEARQSVVKRFDWEKSAENYTRLFNHLLLK
jgi:glycosyltransferase involved in cell wall biosynthesis